MSYSKIHLPLSDLAMGAMQEKIDVELEKIFANIHDLNTEATDKRTLTIKLDFTPDEQRQVVKLNSAFTTKMAKVSDVGTTVLTGKDITSGHIEAQELKSQAPGQTYMDPESGDLKTDVGEPVDVIEKEEKKKKEIIDLQKKRG